MAQAWLPTRRKLFTLAALDVAGRAVQPFLPRAPHDRGGAETERVRRILVVELWNIGDVILTMPFLAELRALFPRAEITLLARPIASEILAGTGLVDEFVPADYAWTRGEAKYNPLAYEWRELRRMFARLRSHEFDVAFECRMHVREHAVLALSGARRRVGYAFGLGDRLLTDAIPIDGFDRHKTDDWLRLLAPFGGAIGVDVPKLNVSQAERRWAERTLSNLGISLHDRLVGVHPGASVPEKRWPLERFGEVATALAGRDGVRVLAFVDPQGYGDALPASASVIRVRVGLREMMALIERCALLVCNDSGPMHIAGALGIPTVAVFGSGIPQWFAPLGQGHRIVTRPEMTCRPCFDGCRFAEPYCLTGIPTQRVIEAANEALGARPG